MKKEHACDSCGKTIPISQTYGYKNKDGSRPEMIYQVGYIVCKECVSDIFSIPKTAKARKLFRKRLHMGRVAASMYWNWKNRGEPSPKSVGPEPKWSGPGPINSKFIQKDIEWSRQAAKSIKGTGYEEIPDSEPGSVVACLGCLFFVALVVVVALAVFGVIELPWFGRK